LKSTLEPFERSVRVEPEVLDRVCASGHAAPRELRGRTAGPVGPGPHS